MSEFSTVSALIAGRRVGRAQPVWDEWDAKEPGAQVRDCVSANAAFLNAVDALTEEERAGWRLDLFGLDLDLAGLLQLRVGEHALHTWDLTVALDPTSTIPPDRAALVLGNLPMVARWAGQAYDDQVSVEVCTTDPERAFHLDLGPVGRADAVGRRHRCVSRAAAPGRGVRQARPRAAGP